MRITFGAWVPESDVSVGAARGQPSTERRVGDAVEHLSARLRNTTHRHYYSYCSPVRLGGYDVSFINAMVCKSFYLQYIYIHANVLLLQCLCKQYGFYKTTLCRRV